MISLNQGMNLTGLSSNLRCVLHNHDHSTWLQKRMTVFFSLFYLHALTLMSSVHFPFHFRSDMNVIGKLRRPDEVHKSVSSANKHERKDRVKQFVAWQWKQMYYIYLIFHDTRSEIKRVVQCSSLLIIQKSLQLALNIKLLIQWELSVWGNTMCGFIDIHFFCANSYNFTDIVNSPLTF